MFEDENIQLAVICPVYNEEKNVTAVANEWLNTLNKVVGVNNYQLIFINDGSTDHSPFRLKEIEQQNSAVKVLNKSNSGHGLSCIYGYAYAAEKKFDWTFQIDSDGQCDPIFFEEFWKQRDKHEWQWGDRKTRDDGWQRSFVSKILSIVVWLGSGVYVRDSNVPYRLMPSGKLFFLLKDIPEDFFLSNVLLSVLVESKYNIKWHNIHFRNRYSGTSKVKGFKFAKIGFNLFLYLIKLRRKFG